MPVLLQRSLVILVVLTFVVVSPAPAAQDQSAASSSAVVYPSSVVLRESDLPPGFAVEPGGESRLALADGGEKLTRAFRRDQSYGGVTMVRNTVWSFPVVEAASDVMRDLPDLLAGQGFAAVDGPRIG
ncbi:MAG: hypothetical protein IT307_07055, partial [Chloroflexi bacterium]|nr:hypothetical protein [Chloroflexota bacterium]